MPTPNGGLITETNEQYYAGAQRFLSDGTGVITAAFNSNLILGDSSSTGLNYTLNNFKLYTSETGLPGTYTEYTDAYTLVDNIITFGVAPIAGNYIAVQLKTLDGGSFGVGDAPGTAIGTAVEENYGSYGYTSLNEVITGFIAAYVGEHKLIPDVKRTDVIFHAKRGLQEFSYDTLKSIKSKRVEIYIGNIYTPMTSLTPSQLRGSSGFWGVTPHSGHLMASERIPLGVLYHGFCHNAIQ